MTGRATPQGQRVVPAAPLPRAADLSPRRPRAAGPAVASRPEVALPRTGPAPRLAALVVTYNRLGQIRETLARLLSEPCDLIYVVDNGSADGTREWLASLNDPRLRVVLSPGNLGGAGGFELGLRRIVADSDPDWIVLMDDDGRPEPGCLSRFLDADMSAYDAVSAAVYLQNGDICEMNRPTINPFWSLGTFLRTAVGTALGSSRSGFHISDEAYSAGPIPIDATSFVGLFLPRHTIARIGYPDGAMFIYGDDVQYTLRVRKAGMTIGFVPDLRFEHDYNRVHSGRRDRFHPIWKAYYTARNGMIVYRYAAGPLFWLALLIILPKWAIAGLKYGDTRRTYYRLLWVGICDGIRGREIRPHAEVMSMAAPS
jgi:GT2 family glycosyltransferase